MLTRPWSTLVTWVSSGGRDSKEESNMSTLDRGLIGRIDHGK
jgi:hypothetical protein